MKRLSCRDRTISCRHYPEAGVFNEVHRWEIVRDGMRSQNKNDRPSGFSSEAHKGEQSKAYSQQ